MLFDGAADHPALERGHHAVSVAVVVLTGVIGFAVPSGKPRPATARPRGTILSSLRSGVWVLAILALIAIAVWVILDLAAATGGLAR